MSRAPIMIRDLTIGKNVWKIVVLFVEIWTVKERNGQHHVEAIIQDAEVL